MSWQPPNYPKGWGKPPPHTPSPVPFRQMYTPSPPHISSKHYPIGSPCMSPTCSSPSSSRLPPPYIPCPKPTRPYPSPISPLAMSSYVPAHQGGPSNFNPMQNYLYQDHQLPTNVYLEPLGPLLHENSLNEQSDGRSTAEIIANQSQDYVDEKLAEYQATIFQLQGNECVHVNFVNNANLQPLVL